LVSSSFFDGLLASYY